MENLQYGEILGEDRIIVDFVGELLLGFIVRFLRDEGVAVDGNAEPSTASGGCSEAEHP